MFKKKKKYTASIACDKEIAKEIIQLFNFEDVEFKKINTNEIFTEITIEVEK